MEKKHTLIQFKIKFLSFSFFTNTHNHNFLSQHACTNQNTQRKSRKVISALSFSPSATLFTLAFVLGLCFNECRREKGSAIITSEHKCTRDSFCGKNHDLQGFFLSTGESENRHEFCCDYNYCYCFYYCFYVIYDKMGEKADPISTKGNLL